MLDIRFVRENPDAVKENIRKKFQDAKLPLVDESSRLTPSTAPPSVRPATCAQTATSCPSRSAR